MDLHFRFLSFDIFWGFKTHEKSFNFVAKQHIRPPGSVKTSRRFEEGGYL